MASCFFFIFSAEKLKKIPYEISMSFIVPLLSVSKMSDTDLNVASFAWPEALPNILMSASNIVALLPVATACVYGDWMTAACSAIAGGASAYYHLKECHKHCIPGWRSNPRLSRFWLQIDRLGVALLVLRMIYISTGFNIRLIPSVWAKLPFPTLALGIAAMACGVGSELCPNQPNMRQIYLAMHGLWHLGAFMFVNFACYHVVWRRS